MSLAYPPRFVKYLFKSTKERDAAKSAQLKPGYYGIFPLTFGLYYSSPGEDFLSQYFHISTLQEAAAEPREDLYAITFHKGPGSKQMTLYSTAQHGSPPMAIATTAKRYGDNILIKLPGEDASGPREVTLRHKGMISNVYTFDHDGDSYELREGQGRPKTRSIVRLGASNSPGSKTKVAVGGDEEVIATWREGSVPNKDGRLAGFQFTSREAADRLGEYGTLLAVSAVVSVCQQGDAVECTMTWQEEKYLEKSNYD